VVATRKTFTLLSLYVYRGWSAHTKRDSQSHTSSSTNSVPGCQLSTNCLNVRLAVSGNRRLQQVQRARLLAAGSKALFALCDAI